MEVEVSSTCLLISYDLYNEGNKVKASIRFKGRQLAHTELGEEVLNRFAEALSEVSEIESMIWTDTMSTADKIKASHDYIINFVISII